MGGRAVSLRLPSSFLPRLLSHQLHFSKPELSPGWSQADTDRLHRSPSGCSDTSGRRKAQKLCAAMSAPGLVILGLLTAVPPASCQQGLGNLQPWMQGLIAVAVFLVLVAIAFAVNHFWCQEEPEPTDMVMMAGNKAEGILVGMDGKYSSMAANFRSSEHENAYENIPEEEVRVQVTPM
ncbi:PDZK1-interacting protein 1 isoform X2 [Manis pentadactyla]|uniref:PDZK1-interacting protein 1 isoform X2 n=1 Tax=Manis pentadactyla TaxID=143292 RepID=UPI001873D59F|nr:PDZK1-interacting protein 1 isoform X2 [Manis pentadactyla]